MKKYIFIPLIVFIVIFLGGCARKSVIDIPNNENLTTQALVIGSLSRPMGITYFREHSIQINDYNNNYIKNIFNTSKEDITDISNPYPYISKDDFKYENSKGSIFSFYLPEGKYIISELYTGWGVSGFDTTIYKKINVNAGDIIYIGDFHFKPVFNKERRIIGAYSFITDQFERDYPVFKKYFQNTDFNKNDVKISVEKDKVPVGRFESHYNPVLYLPPM